MQSREGVIHFRIQGKRNKIRYVPVHPLAQRLIEKHLMMLEKHGGGGAWIWTVRHSVP